MNRLTNNISKIAVFLMGLLLALLILNLIIPSSTTSTIKPTYFPQPIASEKILITSAGQSIDTYIVKDIANDLLLHNTFMPHADQSDLEGINSVVIVVGHSATGELLQEVDHIGELKRLDQIIEQAQNQSLPIISVYIGGKERRTPKTDQLLDKVCTSSTYIIATEDGDYDQFLSSISESFNIPLVKIKDIKNFKAPFSSMFR